MVLSTLIDQPALAKSKSLVLIGGGLKKVTGNSPNPHSLAIYKTVIELAGGAKVAKIGIITAASRPPSQDRKSGTPQAKNSLVNGGKYVEEFKTLGAADAQWIPIDLDNIHNNSSPAVVQQVNQMTGFFFGGGDQSRLIECFLNNNKDGEYTDSPVLTAIRQKYASGAVIAGTSAGTVIHAGGTYVRDNTRNIPMITSGESYEALKHGFHISTAKKSRKKSSYDKQGGFGFFKYGTLDTHFAERGRQGRIVRLAWDTGIQDAYAPDENTALVVTDVDTPQAKMSVIGKGGVNIFDLSSAGLNIGACSKVRSRYWKLCGIKYTYLTQDDQYDPLTRKVTIASWKSSLTGKEKYRQPKFPSEDIFTSPKNRNSRKRRAHPHEMVNVANNLFNSQATSTYGLTYESFPTFKVTLTKEKSAGSTGYYGTNIAYGKFYSFKNLLVDFYTYPSLLRVE
ncbi:MAG: cyanophycinase [Calothrix sp. MO_167.B42]|nr:cyanophycinase [Calothrix sp. MO_167.B42]